LKLNTLTTNNLSQIRTILEADDKEPIGNIATIRKLTEWVAEYNRGIQKACDTNNIRMARLHLIEMVGALEQMKTIAKELSKELGLPDLEIK